MSSMTRDTSQALRAVVKVAENICSLPAVATQDWCDRAALALLPIAQPAVAITMIGQISDRGEIVRQEATGVAGLYIAEVTTQVGRTNSAPTAITIDPNDANLVQVRTNLAQARDLHWTPGHLPAGQVKAGPAERFGVSILDISNSVSKRWSAYRLQGLLLGAAAIGPAGRVLIVEMASSNVALGEAEAAQMEAVLPLLARRAIMAIGTDPSEAAAWLTAREQIILQHLLLGKSVREIAEELGRSPHTVHDHVKSLHRKLGANSRGELVARALGYSEMMAPTAEKAPEGAPVAANQPQIHVRPIKGPGQTA
ncbi:MAG TPA: LuxR C-terminal-related transcriptional regulator [Phycisphaerales bacterium]|nr:LuxR C-terminal-related transcriptional regulator [Phycisphaerales bacterium]